MNRPAITLALLSLALGACVEETGTNGAAEIPPVGGSGGSTGPVDDGNTQDPPNEGTSSSPSGGDAQPTTTVSTGSSAIPSSLYTGANENDFDSFWKCYEPGVTDPDAYTSFLFHTDMNGAYAASGNVYQFAYTISADTIQLQIPGVEQTTQLLDVRFDGRFAFAANFRVGDGDNPINCGKADLDGNLLGTF